MSQGGGKTSPEKNSKRLPAADKSPYSPPYLQPFDVKKRQMSIADKPIIKMSKFGDKDADSSSHLNCGRSNTKEISVVKIDEEPNTGRSKSQNQQI